MNRFSVIIAIAFFVFAGVIVFFVFERAGGKVDAAMAVTLVLLTGVGKVVLEPLIQPIKSLVNRPSISSSVYRVCVFGRAGVGKTTFIENTFTILDPDKVQSSTERFDYYRFSVPISLKTSAEIEIADYKGQNPSQIIQYGSPYFFGLPQHRMLNTIIFIVDLVPRRYNHDGAEDPLNDEALLKWLREENTISKIERRVQEHREYINEASLELFFSSMYSERLKSVLLLINKLDLIAKLIDDKSIDVKNYSDVDTYATHLFEPIIKNLSQACSQLGIVGPLVLPISSKNRNNLALVISNILSQRS